MIRHLVIGVAFAGLSLASICPCFAGDRNIAPSKVSLRTLQSAAGTVLSYVMEANGLERELDLPPRQFGLNAVEDQVLDFIEVNSNSVFLTIQF